MNKSAFIKQAVHLVSHRFYMDYLATKEMDKTVEPEYFFDVWSENFMTKVDQAFKDEVFHQFMTELVHDYKQRRKHGI